MATRILAVDDSRSMLEVVSFTLEAAGYEVHTAGDGEEALSQLDALNVDMVLTDLYMPKLDGVGLVRAIRARPDTRFLPVIMLTTESHVDKKDLGRTAGATGWIVKPFTPDQLLGVIRKIVGAAC